MLLFGLMLITLHFDVGENLSAIFDRSILLKKVRLKRQAVRWLERTACRGRSPILAPKKKPSIRLRLDPIVNYYHPKKNLDRVDA